MADLPPRVTQEQWDALDAAGEQVIAARLSRIQRMKRRNIEGSTMTNETTASQPKSIGDDRDFMLALDDYADAVRDGAISKRVGARWHLERTIDNFHAPADQVSTPIHKAPSWPERTYVSATIQEPVMVAEPVHPELTVWYGSMPESNGKSNFTAIVNRKDAKGLDVFGGYTIARSEYPERVRYEADCMRFLIGEIDKEPFILDYDADKHSGYVPPAATVKAVPSEALDADCLSCDASTRFICHRCKGRGKIAAPLADKKGGGE